MKIITLKEEECPYCDINIKIEPDIDKSIFNWHLKGHNQIQEFYETNNEIEKLISEYAHDFRSDRYDKETMVMVFRDFFKKTNNLEEIKDLKNYIQALEYKIESLEKLKEYKRATNEYSTYDN